MAALRGMGRTCSTTWKRSCRWNREKRKYDRLEEEGRLLKAGNAIDGRVPVAIGIFGTDLKEDFGLSDGCVILGVGRQTPHKEAVIEMLYYEFMGEGHSH